MVPRTIIEPGGEVPDDATALALHHAGDRGPTSAGRARRVGRGRLGVDYRAVGGVLAWRPYATPGPLHSEAARRDGRPGTGAPVRGLPAGAGRLLTGAVGRCVRNTVGGNDPALRA